MKNLTLTVVDVRKVQTYLFNANELKQNLGASALVEQATHAWIVENLPKPHNVAPVKDNPFLFEIVEKLTIEDGKLKTEVIYLGGGNASILFAEKADSREFAKDYTRKVLSDAPGLEVAVAHVDGIDLGENGALQQAWKEMQQDKMPAQKQGRLVSQPILGLGVTAECSYTGLPAVDEDPDGKLLSAEAQAKQSSRTVSIAKDRLNNLLDIPGFDYPSSFEDIGGERGHARYIAVVHADGNDMGKRIKTYAESSDNREMTQRLRKFSGALNQIGLKSIQKIRDWMAIAIEVADDEKKSYTLIDRWDENSIVRLKNSYLPIRPLVFGGDDITFVCDGRLGLALAAKFLQAFSEGELPDERPVHACAGVAIVQSNYPFARAYALASELCSDAKQQARKWDK